MSKSQKCKNCWETYDTEKLKFSVGDVPWLYDFCSARCYTQVQTQIQSKTTK